MRQCAARLQEPVVTVSATPAAAVKASAAKPRADLGLSAKEAKARADALLRAGSPENAKALEDVRTLARSAAQARQEAREATKTWARERVVQLREQFQLIRRLYAHNPQEMARQLSRIFKELKAALKVYAEATKEEPGAAPSLAAGVAELKDAAADGPQQQEKPEPTAREAYRALLKEGADAYRKTTEAEHRLTIERRHEEAQGTLAFLDEVRGLVKVIRQTYFEARIKAVAAGGDRSEAFKDADKALRELEDEIADMEIDARAHILPATDRADATA
jgi:hypothetical protein